MNTSNPLPYSIFDVMNSSPYKGDKIRQRMLLVAKYLEDRSAEFYQLFGVSIIFFVDPTLGFDYSKFADVVLETMPTPRINEYQVVSDRYGKRAAELIVELINAFNNTKELDKDKSSGF